MVQLAERIDPVTDIAIDICDLERALRDSANERTPPLFQHHRRRQKWDGRMRRRVTLWINPHNYRMSRWSATAEFMQAEVVA